MIAAISSSVSSPRSRSAEAAAGADWPGLAKSQRHEGRDLRVTTDLRAVMKGLLSDHLKLSSAAIDNTVLPGSAAVKKVSLLA